MTDNDVEIELRVRERTAHLEAARRELEAFVAAVATDLRARLRAILGVAHVFTQEHAGGATAGSRECVDCICLNAEQMARMLDGLIRISGSEWREPVAAKAGGPNAAHRRSGMIARPDTVRGVDGTSG